MSFVMEHTRLARVAPSAVFAAYVDPSTWGAWGHNTRWARLDGPFEVGAVVDVQAGYRKVWPVVVAAIEPERRVVCEIRPPGVLLTSSFEVDESKDGARIHHAIAVEGPLELGYRPLALLYRRLLAKETAKLVAFVAEQGDTGA